MARRKNMKRRRVILGNTFRLIRENGMDNVSLQMIAEKSGISKSLLQSYYPHKATLTNDIVRHIFNTIGTEVNHYYNAQNKSPFAITKAFIYTIGSLSMHDAGWDRIISDAFVSNKTLDAWRDILNKWVADTQIFAAYDINKIETGTAFVTTGIGRLYRDRKRQGLSSEDLADIATSTLMFSFLHLDEDKINTALAEGHEIIESADMEIVHQAVDSMFEENADVIG